MVIEQEQSIEQIKKLEQFLPEGSKEEMAQILAYWEKIKAEWERKKKEFWENHKVSDFVKLLKYKRKHQKEIEWKYEYLNIMKWLEREKYIEEYLYDDMLYSGELDEIETKRKKRYSYEDWKEWKVVMEEWARLCFFCGAGKAWIWLEWVKLIAENMELKEWVTLDLSSNWIWDKWVEVISKMKLEEWVTLDLNSNNIWEKWAEAIAKNMKLKEWVTLNLKNNHIWYEWVEAISKMELKEWVTLCLDANGIWDKWAEAIANMNLEKWVTLDLQNNWIWDKWVEAISKMELKEWVILDLSSNTIWKQWIRAIIENMELKDWVILKLRDNWLSEDLDVVWKLLKWEKSYHDKWINCEVIV